MWHFYGLHKNKGRITTLVPAKQSECCIKYAGISQMCFEEVQCNAAGVCQVKHLKEMMFGKHKATVLGEQVTD